MQHKTIEYFDGDQKLIGELICTQPSANQQPAIIVFHAFEGRGEFTIDYAKKLATEGFTVFVADIYGDAQVADTLTGCFDLVAPFLADRELVRRRAMLTFDTLLKQPQVDKNKISAAGFCFGGQCLLELARSGANLVSGVIMHSKLRKSTLPTHPIKSKLLLLQGYQDPQVPPTEITAFAEEMTAAGVHDWTFTFFGEAKHSFTDPRTGTFDPIKEKETGREYNQVVSERAFRYSIDFFKE